MTKEELIDKVAERMNRPRSEVHRIINEAVGLIANALLNKDRVQISGLGVFTVKQRGQKRARNPKTGQDIVIPPRYVASFSATKHIKETLKRA